MTSKSKALARISVFTLISFSLTFIPDIICIKVWGYEKWLSSPFGVIVTLTMVSPMIANILTRIITKEGFDDLSLSFSLTDGKKYYAYAYFIPIIFGVIISLIVNITHGSFTFEALRESSFYEVFTIFMSVCITPLFYYSFCCFGEEFGWRGYLNQRLEALTGTAGAVIIGGIIWGLWHGVLVFNGYNFGSEHPLLGIALMCVSCISLNAVMMYLTKKAHSVFPAVILHTVLDMGVISFTVQCMAGGLSGDIEKKITPLQSGILMLVIPEAVVGTVFFILLMRSKRKEPQKA